MKEDSIYIDHILQSIHHILTYISGKDHDSFEEDQMTQDAVIRQFEVMGEAAKRVSKEFRKNYPDIPWSDMAGMRDILIHDYIDVDLDVVWKTATEDVPILKGLLEKLK